MLCTSSGQGPLEDAALDFWSLPFIACICFELLLWSQTRLVGNFDVLLSEVPVRLAHQGVQL